MQLTNVSNIPQKIFKFLNKETQRLAKEVGFTQHRSKLVAPAFLKALLATCFSQQFSLELCCSFLKEQGVNITKQGLHERFNHFTAQLLQKLAEYCLKHFETKQLIHLPYLMGFSGVNIVDSSSVSLHHSLNSLFKGSGGAASSAAVKIQLMFDYLQGQIKAITLTSGCDNDQGFDNYFEIIQTEALYLMDLGYFKLGSFKKIIEGNAYFVSRLLTGTKLLELGGKPVNLIKALSKSGSLFTQQLLMGAKHKIPIRLVAQRLPKPIAEKRRCRLLEDHRRSGSKPSHESLVLQEWSIYITNTSETQISNEDIHKIYSLRWQIELLFKLSKSLMSIDSIRSSKSARVVIETYGKFIGMMLLFLLCAPVRYQNNREVSFYKACKLLISRVNDLVHSFTSLYRLKQFLKKFQDNLKLFANKGTKSKKRDVFRNGESF